MPFVDWDLFVGVGSLVGTVGRHRFNNYRVFLVSSKQQFLVLRLYRNRVAKNREKKILPRFLGP